MVFDDVKGFIEYTGDREREMMMMMMMKVEEGRWTKMIKSKRHG